MALFGKLNNFLKCYPKLKRNLGFQFEKVLITTEGSTPKGKLVGIMIDHSTTQGCVMADRIEMGRVGYRIGLPTLP